MTVEEKRSLIDSANNEEELEEVKKQIAEDEEKVEEEKEEVVEEEVKEEVSEEEVVDERSLLNDTQDIEKRSVNVN